MISSNFWQQLAKPIMALSPMDGVTDAAFRYMVAKYSKPSVIFTEFTNVEGLSRGINRLLDDFMYSSIERPVIAQIFGSTPNDFYTATIIACELGFDGIDINMGCPDNEVAKRGGGAALILNPPLAKKIIRSCQQAVLDWSNGKQIDDISLREEFTAQIISFKHKNQLENIERKILPVSVKTRIGVEDIVITEWVQHLLECEVENISIHGRTLKQMYTGLANWEEIGKAAEIIKKTDTTVLGNGDIKSLEEGNQKVKDYNLDGVLIGRATFGNPYFFSSNPPELSIKDKLAFALEHSKYYLSVLPDKPFVALRKHLAWYAKGIENATDLRMKLVRINNIAELEEIYNQF